MEDSASAGMFAFTVPVLYATSAVVITAAALVFGYLYTQKQSKDVAKTTMSQKDQKTTDAQKTKGKDGKQKTTGSPVVPGTWPVDDASKGDLPIPENAPEHLKKVLEMGFPGCPMFRPQGPSVATQPAAECCGRTEAAPQALPIPEDIPENLKKVLEMGFPGCPMFRRPGASTDPENVRPESQSQATSDSPAGAPKVLPIPDNVPENLKKVLEMGFPGCPMFQRPGNKAGIRKETQTEPGKRKVLPADKKVVSEVFDMFEEQFADELAGKRLEDPFNSGLGGPLSVAQFDARLQERLAEMELEKRLAEAKQIADEERQAKAKRRAEEKLMAEQKGPVKEKSLAEEITLAEGGAAGQDAGDSADQVIHTPDCPRAEHCTQHCTCYKFPAANAASQPDKGDHTKEVERDPVEYCSHLQSEVKRTQQKVAASKIEEEMTVEQKEHERDVQREQLEAIFKLMQKQEDKFGVDSMDDIQSQMKLYM